MADESFELEDGVVSSNVPVLQLMRLVLEQRHLRDAIRVLNEETQHGVGEAAHTLLVLDVFRDCLNTAVVDLQHAGIVDDDQIRDDLPQLASRAFRDAVHVWNEQQAERVSRYGVTEVDVDVGPTPAAATVVISLEKQAFHAATGGEDHDDSGGGATECSICFEEFVEGELVTVMPCPSHGHRFHPECIANWLEIRNTCPLCRHQLPTADAIDL